MMMRMTVESCIPLGNVLRLGRRNFAEAAAAAAVEFLRFTNQETFNKFKTILKALAGLPASQSVSATDQELSLFLNSSGRHVH